jgi:regulator of protease activity HflC (stomatin/prohibitin superfamily)
MAEQEINVIGHLLDVEKDASVLVSDAQSEAAKRLAAARAQADIEYKKQYDQLISRLEIEYQQKTAAVTQTHADALNTYKEKAEKTVRDTVSFGKLLDSLMFSA